MSDTNVVPMQQSTNVVPVSQAGSLLQAITSAASNPAVDIEKMERLFVMHQQMVKQEAETAFNAAMARAQAQMVPVVRDRANDFTRSTYATLAAINDAIAPIYTAEGFSISFDTGECALAGHIRTIAYVSHSAGHTRTHHNDMPLDSAGSGGKVNKTPIQASGSTQSYARRYLVCQIFNVTTEDDSDGNKRRHSATDGAGQRVAPERRSQIQEMVSGMKEHIANGSVDDAVLTAENFGLDDADEWAFMWTFFQSSERSAMKKASAAMREAKKAAPDVITEAQRKRLEAMISERGIPRETIKKMCYEDFAVEHFKDLSPHQYDLVCKEVEQSSAAPIPPSEPVFTAPEAAAAGRPVINLALPEVYWRIEQALEFASESIKERFKLLCGGVEVPLLTLEKADKAHAWLKAAIDKEAQ